MMPIITVGKHRIEAINIFWGTEIVKYDGKTKTKVFLCLATRAIHTFLLKDSGQQARVGFLLAAAHSTRRTGFNSIAKVFLLPFLSHISVVAPRFILRLIFVWH